MIQQINSNGTLGLPHYKSSRAAMELMEPIWMNLFTVEIMFPQALNLSVEESNLILEGLQKVDGLDTNKVPAAGTSQYYKFAQRRFANSGPDSTVLDIKFDFEVNLQGCQTGRPNMYTIKNLRRWSDLIYDPLTGRQGLKSEYVADQVIVTFHDKALDQFWEWRLYNVWPTTSITPPTPDYQNKSTAYKITGYTLACDYWDEIML